MIGCKGGGHLRGTRVGVVGCWGMSGLLVLLGGVGARMNITGKELDVSS